MKKVVAIIGVGMMGGSLGLALRKRRSPYRVVGIGRNAGRLARARNLGACDRVTTDFKKGLENADLVVIGTTVGEIVPAFRRISPFLRAGAVVTDIGSVKAAILRDANQVLESRPKGSGVPDFIGGHPLAGSEKSGVANAREDLFAGATVVLCPRAGIRKSSLGAIRSLWRSAGAKPIVLDPEIHDILVAQTSHLPHVLAAALVKMLANLKSSDPDSPKLLAGSFRDLTRIADSDPRQWAEIACANQKFILGAVRSYRDVMKRILETVESAEDPFSKWESFFSEAKRDRKLLLS
jgi:prephenate dehydrogenase